MRTLRLFVTAAVIASVATQSPPVVASTPVIAIAPVMAIAAKQPPPVFELPEVVVPGRRPQAGWATPASVTVVTRADLERIGARTIADVLRLVPEALARTYGGYGSLAEPAIRGFGPGQVLVLIDGVPVTNVALGQTDLSTISIVGVERVEVLRGAFGAISGSGAVGGVINIVTTGAPGSAFRVRIGGFGERQVQVSAATGGAVISIETAGADGFRPNSDVAAFTAVGQLDLGSGVRLGIHHTRLHLGTPGDIALPTPQDRQSLTRTLAQANWTNDSAGRGRLYAVAESLVFTSPFGTSTYRSLVTGGELQRQWDLSPGRVLVGGLEIQRQALDALVFGSSIVQDATAAAAYLQADTVLSGRGLASAAVRLDAHSAYGLTLNPRAGVVLRLDDRTRLRFGVGRTFRGPTFLHLYFPGCSNPSLRPETAWTAEASLERAAGRARAVVTGFASEATDLISGGCPPQNIGAASIRGISADVRIAISPALGMAMNMTLQSAVDRATGSPLPRVPGLTARAVLTYAPHPGTAVTVLAEYVGPRADVDFSVFPALAVQLPAYGDVALRYARQLPSGWTITLGIDNLLDASYEVVKGYPVPGRTVFVTASRRF